MKCEFLTEERWDRYLEDRLSSDESSKLFQHLEQGCPGCEKFIESLDEEADKLIRGAFRYSVSEKSAQDPSSANRQFRGIMKKLGESEASRKGRLVYRPWILRPAWVGIMVLFIIGTVVALWLGPIGFKPVQQEKGIEHRPNEVVMSFAIGNRQADGTLQIKRGVFGESYDPSDHLFLQVQDPSDRFIYLLIVNQGKIDLLYEGRTEKQEEGDLPDYIVDISLENYSGLNVVVSAFSDVALDPDHDLIPRIAKAAERNKGLLLEERLQGSNSEIQIKSIYFDVEGKD